MMINGFKERFRELRKEKELSQSELACHLKTKRYHISNLEQGRAEPDLDFLITIAHYFNVTVDYLLGIEDMFCLNNNP